MKNICYYNSRLKSDRPPKVLEESDNDDDDDEEEEEELTPAEKGKIIVIEG